MKYIIIPSSLLEEKEVELLKLGLSPRYSIDKSEAILHTEHYDMLFPTIQTKSIDSKSAIPYMIYNSPSPELEELLTSSVWSDIEEINSTI